MTTLFDVARRAGVSKSTVSNVIRGDGRFAKATRERVEQAIVDVQYHPNVIARSKLWLMHPRSNTRFPWQAETINSDLGTKPRRP